ncbi:MBL fold metallo-hydrolase [Paenibacillus pinihumi]|uniref:MBL fold metallo-hydrolase n=1 Tax=Paenibacillus pinihumi TaxID=669462 RepID=UPI00041C772E|nr:MBL fold metallo-hydrolase [Paenibacillus pinihumi]
MSINNHPVVQVPAVYHRRIGDITVTVISDGHSELPFWPYYELSEDIGKEMLQADFETSPIVLNTNCFIVNIQGRITLIDAGLGMGIGTALSNIKAAGIDVQDIATVLLTHIHPDHTNGLIHTDGTRVFPNAEVVVQETEFSYWMDSSNISNPSDRQEAANFQMAQAAFAPYESRIRTFTSSEKEPVPGIQAIAAPGHTPGHTVYLIESKGEKLLIWGDVIHNTSIQLQRPEEKVIMDVCPEVAVETRIRILDFAAGEQLLVTGMHLHFPGFSYIRKDKDRYVLLPEKWKPSL